MEHLPKKIHQNGISYTLVGDYYIPDLKLPEESRPIGRWGRMHKTFLQEHRPGQYNALLLFAQTHGQQQRRRVLHDYRHAPVLSTRHV